MKDNQGRRTGEGRIETENKRGNENKGSGSSKVDKAVKETKDKVNKILK